MNETIMAYRTPQVGCCNRYNATLGEESSPVEIWAEEDLEVGKEFRDELTLCDYVVVACHGDEIVAKKLECVKAVRVKDPVPHFRSPHRIQNSEAYE